MYITVHAAAGAAVGAATGNPILAFVGGFVSHIILDMIPHGDETISKWKFFKTVRRRITAAALIDFAGVVLVLIYMINHANLNLLPGILMGMAGGVAPDALWGFHELTNTPLLAKYRKWHSTMHNYITKKKITLKQGLVVQIPLFALFVWLTLR